MRTIIRRDFAGTENASPRQVVCCATRIGNSK
jgi:hypothetical protein